MFDVWRFGIDCSTCNASNPFKRGKMDSMRNEKSKTLRVMRCGVHVIQQPGAVLHPRLPGSQRREQACLPQHKAKAGRETHEAIKARSRARYAQLKSSIADFKNRLGCKDCGYNKHHAALQFDHVSGEKSRNIGSSRSLREFYEEVGKCEVVCANCHHIRTYARCHIAKGLMRSIFQAGTIEDDSE